MPRSSLCVKFTDAVKTDNLTWNRLLDIADNKNIIVYMGELLGTVNGFYYRKDDIKIICIKELLKDDQKNFVFAHELGHSVLHRNCGDLVFAQSDDEKQRIRKAELEADRFAEKLIKLLERRILNS